MRFPPDGGGETAYSWGQCGATSLVYPVRVGEVQLGMKAGQLMPAGRGFQILAMSEFATEGEHMLRTQADTQNAPWLLSYAATHGSSYAVILINRDRDNSHIVPISFAGKTSGNAVKQWVYGRAQYDLTRRGDWSAAPIVTTYGHWTK